MLGKTKFLSLLIVLGLLLSTQPASAASEQSVNALDEQILFAYGPSGEELDQVLAANYPDWANFEQTVSWYSKPVKVGKIVREASFQEKFALNSAVTLVTLGETLNWQIPPDTDLFSESLAVGERLDHLWSEWTNPANGQIRTQFPEVANGATYAIYAFFDYDIDKLLTWQTTYDRLFGDRSSQPSISASLQSSASIEPFLARPFYNPNDSFYSVNSFFDHDYPRYEGEGDGHTTTLYRFDGKVLENAGFEACDVNHLLGIACYSGHDAYDYNTPLGWKVRAAASGTVIDTLDSTGTVIIGHSNGLYTVYMHLDQTYVKKDDVVEQGGEIGEAGNKGTGGVHLHFGVRYPDNVEKDIDPFGWWSLDPDPWVDYPTLGQESTWLWKADEAGDGSLTVDNRESQAQLFLFPQSTPPSPPEIGWHRVTSGYQGEAWYTFMNKYTDTSAYWAIWGTTIDQPGEYVVQAYWPSDPDTGDEWLPSSNARYTFYFHENGVLQKALLYGNQTIGANQFNPLCKVELVAGSCPTGQIARFTFDQGPTTLILSNPALYDISQHQKILFFDAVQWEPYSPPTPTPTEPPSGQSVRISVSSGSDDAGTNPTPCIPNATDNEIYLGACNNGGSITSGFLFRNVQIPPGATIESAYIHFTVDGPYSQPIHVKIHGEDIGNASDYSAPNPPPSGRSLTTNFTSWDISDPWTLGEFRTTPDFSSAIDEIVNHNPNWNSGQNISIILTNFGSTSVRRVIAFERASFDPSLKPAELEITYSFNGTPPPTSTPTDTPTPTITPTDTPTPVPTTPPPPCNCILELFGWCQPASAQLAQLQSISLTDGTTTPIPSNPESLASTSASSIDPAERAALIYRVRDELMGNSTEGQRLTNLYYDHSLEIATLMLSDNNLYDQGFAALDAFLPGLQALVDGNGGSVVITTEQVAVAQAFLDALSSRASPELQQAIQQEQANNPLENMVGLTMSQAWSYISGNFPTTGILDNFDRANGSIGSNWSGNISSYSISSNKLLVRSKNSNLDLYWKNTSFGPNQEAYFTFASTSSTAIDQDLLLKVQSLSGWGYGLIDVQYNAATHRVTVWTYDHMQSWVQYDADIPVTFVNGDQFGARALANGRVEIYRNGLLIATRDISAWPHNASGGYLGLWFGNAKDVLIDNFGGGTMP